MVWSGPSEWTPSRAGSPWSPVRASVCVRALNSVVIQLVTWGDGGVLED